MRLVKLSEFIDRTWESDRKPDKRTVLRAFNKDELPAIALRQIGRRYFVDLDLVADPVDEVVQKVLDAA